MSEPDPYEREAAKAAIKALQSELSEAREDAKDHKHMLQSLSKIQALERAELDRSFQYIMKQRDTLAEALHSIRHRLGDFQEPWNSRETDIDSIAHQAIAAVKGVSHE